MTVTILDILHYALKTLEIDIDGQNLLIDNEISSARNILNAMDYTYQTLLDNKHYKFFAADRYLILII